MPAIDRGPRMRRFLLVLAATATLGGCVSLLEEGYDSRARHDCDRSTDSRDRGECYDRVEQHRRERRE
ncbi:MAG: hypothetical protein AB7P97_09230 [Hyphomonadaceae bacterium]